MKIAEILSASRLEELLDRIGGVNAVMIGDMCLDIYWSADMTRSVLSRETPHFPLPVTEERMSPGAGGNAAVNMITLEPKQLCVLGVVGTDWRGRCLTEALGAAGINTEGLVRVEKRVTNAYCKPMRRGYSGEETEDPRLDFESYEPLGAEAEQALIGQLTEAAQHADVLCVSDQFENGCITPAVRQAVNRLGEQGLLVVADSRSRIGAYRHAVVKPNEIECARALGWDATELSREKATLPQLFEAAQALAQTVSGNVCLTVGDRGAVTVNGGNAAFAAAVAAQPPVDTVGAGDCFLAAFSLALAAGATYAEAACLGNLAAGVSVKKIGTTGSASRQEIRALFEKEGNAHGGC